MASTHLAFDLGAGSVRAILGTLVSGRMRMEVNTVYQALADRVLAYSLSAR